MNISGGIACGLAAPWAPAEPDDDFDPCCAGAAMNGPQGCTCWEPVYDVQQSDELRPGPPGVQAKMCGDCAYRPGSPERADAFEEENLLELPWRGEPFFCHAGIRRAVRYRHPDGREVEAPEGDYDPPIEGRLPFKADGSPGDLCAGWAAIALKAAWEART